MKYVNSLYYILLHYVISGIYPTKFGCKLKNFCLKWSGIDKGKNLLIHLGVFISGHKNIKIGDDCVLSKDCILMGKGGILLGDRVLVGYSSKILTGAHVIPKGLGSIRFSGHTYKPIRIGKDVWIGSNCVIMPGVNIGDNSIIAAGAIVNRDVPANVIFGGVPGKILKQRI